MQPDGEYGGEEPCQATAVATPGGPAGHTDLADANPPNDTMHISPTTAALHDSGSFVAPPQSVSVARLVA